MSSINLAIIVGRLGRDPEIHGFPNGSFITRLSIATSSRWIDKNTGEQKEQTEWHNISIHGIMAKIAFQDLKKGDLVYIEGSLKTIQYKDNQGITKYLTEISAHNVYPL